MTRGAKKKMEDGKLKKVLRLTCLKLLSFQLYMTTWSLLTCSIHSTLVAMSPSGGKRLPPLVCASLGPATCVYKVTSEAAGGERGSPMQTSEAELLRRLRQNDRSAFEAAIEQHYRSVYGQLWHLCGDAETAADLTQDVLQAV